MPRGVSNLHKQEIQRNHQSKVGQPYRLSLERYETFPKCSNDRFDFEQNHLTKDIQHQDEQKPRLEFC